MKDTESPDYVCICYVIADLSWWHLSLWIHWVL